VLIEKNLKGGAQLQLAVVAIRCRPIVRQLLRFFDEVLAMYF
jgi:hypothetical protein